MTHQVKCELIKRLVRKGMIPEAEVACLEFKVGEKTFNRLIKEVQNESC